MATFDGILSGQADQAPFWFPWAYHGTPTRSLASIAKDGLRTADLTYPHEYVEYRTSSGRVKRMPVLFFAACPSFAAGYAVAGTSKKEGVVLRFPWPEDARSWTSDFERTQLAALHQACTTGVIPPFAPQRWRGKLHKKWWFVDDRGRLKKLYCTNDEFLPYNREYVSARAVPPELIEVYTGSVTSKMLEGCEIDDLRFAKKPWVPLLDYVRRRK